MQRIGRDEILEKFSKWEGEEIYLPLSPIMVELMLDELAEARKRADTHRDIGDGFGR